MDGVAGLPSSDVSVGEAEQRDEGHTGGHILRERDEKLPPDSNAYGDWIYLNGTQNVLIEYQVTLYHQKPYP